jgi:hypothetical protein
MTPESPTKPPLTLDELLFEAQRVLHLNQKELALQLQVSVRSLQRWAKAPDAAVVALVAKRLAPLDRALAERAAAMIGESLDDLVPPKPVAATPDSTARPLVELAVEALVFGAARELGTQPEKLREVLRAVFSRARAAGIGIEEVLRVLG